MVNFKTKPILSAYDKELQVLQNNLVIARNRLRGYYNFGKIKTYQDYLVQAGFDASQIAAKNLRADELDRKISIKELNDLIDDESISQRAALWLKHNPPAPEKEEIKIELTPAKIVDEILHEIDGDEAEAAKYELPDRPNRKVHHYTFQKKAILELLKKLEEKRRGNLLVSATGTGKTYIIGELIATLKHQGFFKQSHSPWPCVWVTKASVVAQTKRVLEEVFGLSTIRDVVVINIDQLRAKFGDLYVEEKIVVRDGESKRKYEWRQIIHPYLMIWDECQVLKNTDSTQSRIGQAFNDIKDTTYQIFVSATPFTRVCEAKCFGVSTRIKHDFGLAKNVTLTNDHWTDFAEKVADPFDPIEHSPGAIDKLMDKLDDYVVRCKGVRWQFKAMNQVKIVDFDNEEDSKFYHSAWDRYLKEKNKLEEAAEGGAAVSRFQILAQFTKFRQASELCHSKHITDAMVDAYYKGQAPVAGLNFKHTVIKCVKLLIEKHGFKRDDISIIWGGGVVKNAKIKQKESIESDPLIMEALKNAGVSLDDMGLGDDDVDAVDKLLQDEHIPKEYQLGPQNKKQRQIEIDRFQSGKSKFCFFTFKSGGVGLSLHHTDELSPVKARRKKSGYAVEADIKNVTTKPRICFLTPTYSAMELVQGLGRCPRINSLSDTPQIILFFRGTIEERVAAIVSMKLRCLTKVVRQKESWEDVIIGAKSDTDAEARALIKYQDAEKDAVEFVEKNKDTEDVTLDMTEDEDDEIVIET